MPITIVCVRYIFAHGGGPELILKAMAKYLNKERYRLVVVLWLHPVSSEAFRHVLEKEGVEVEVLRTHRFNPRIIFQFVKIIKKYHAQILHTHDFLSDIWGIVAGRIAGCKTLCSAHGFVQCSWKIKAYEYLDLKLMKYFDRVIAGSNSMAGFLRAQGVEDKRISVIHNSIDHENILPCGKECNFRKEFSIQENESIVGVLGRLSSEKGHNIFLKAIADIKQHTPKACRYVIVGDGAEKTNLQLLAKKLQIPDRVIFTGYYHNIYCFLKFCDIFVLPSLRESLPLVLLEAMSFGIPVVATDVGGISELINDKSVGFLIKPGSSKQLGEAILQILSNSEAAERIGEKGRQRVTQQFSARRMIQKLSVIYQNL